MATEKMTIDQMAEKFLAESRDATNSKRPEKVKFNVPAETMRKAMISQGVDKESLDNFGDATANVTRAMHHACSMKLREDILKNRGNKELLGKISVTGRGEIVPRCMRLTVEVNGERRGTTVPREGQPSKEYVNYGTGRTMIEITSALNEQRNKDSEDIKKAFEDLNK